MEETTWDHGPERSGGPLEVMRQRLLRVIASSPARIPQRYGYVLTWGLVPESLEDIDAHCEMRPAFHILTPGGEFLALTRALVAPLGAMLSRVNGIPLIMDIEPSLTTWSTAPGVPITALDILYIAYTDPLIGADHELNRSFRESVSARKLEHDIYVTLARKPEGWPI